MSLYPVPYISFDTNCLNSKGKIDEMNQIERWSEEQLVDLGSSEAMWQELPEGPGPMRDKACESIFRGGEDHLDRDEIEKISQIREIVFPQKHDLTPQDHQDVRHLFDHQKNRNSQHAFFVSYDRKHILSHKRELLEQFGIFVGTPAECVAWAIPIVEKARRWMERERRDFGHQPGGTA